jgi:trehalose/maltose hydrolase-like predicted phosphorylase
MLDVSTDELPQNQELVVATDWNIVETEFEPTQLYYKESIFTIGNGYLETRGTFEEGYPQDCPATLIQGVYNDMPIVHKELLNCPNWLPLVVTLVGDSPGSQVGDRFSMDSGEIINYERRLDLRVGVVSRDVRWRSPEGHTLNFHFERFASLADKHVLAIRCQVTSIDFVGDIKVEVGFDTKPDNQGVQHWQILNQGGVEQIIWLQSHTLHSNMQLGMAAKLVLEDDTALIHGENAADSSRLVTTFESFPGRTVTVEKIVTLYTSRDTNVPIAAAIEKLADEARYTTLLAAHIAAWEQMWQDNDMIIEGDHQAQLSVRYNLFQLMAVVPTVYKNL